MTDQFPLAGRIAGIDYGQVRIGIAITDAGRSIASPWENYTRRGEAADARYFQELVAQEDLQGFVVGLPLHMSGDESQKSAEARRFGAWLQAETRCPVTFHDERYSSAAADAFMVGAELTSKQRKKRRDMLAAQVILSSFLEQSSESPERGGRPLE